MINICLIYFPGTSYKYLSDYSKIEVIYNILESGAFHTSLLSRYFNNFTNGQIIIITSVFGGDFTICLEKSRRTL